MSSSQVEKSDSDVEMGEAGQAPSVPASQAPAVQEATPSLTDGFDSFKAKLSRRSAAKGSKRARIETPNVPSAAPTPLPAPSVPSPEVPIHPSGSSTAPIVISGREDAIESAPLPPAKRELVLGLPAAGAALLPKGRARAGATSGAKKKRGAKSEESELSEPLARQFVSLIDGMLGECGSEVIRLSKELESSQEVLKRTKAALQTVEDTHAAQTPQLEVRISDPERDLGKTASSLLKVKKEKRSKSSEFRTCLARIVDSLDSLAVVHVRYLALDGVEGGMRKVQLFHGEAPLSPRAEDARLSAHRAELVDEEGDFNQILSGLRSKFTLSPCSGKTEGQDLIAEEGEDSMVPNPEGVICEDEALRAKDD
ncbi:hypothetical protein Bca101_010084 [Brassica carinata]